MVGNREHQLPDKLIESLAAQPRLAIAFSGGLDSRFLCHAAFLGGCEILLFHVSGPHVPEADSAFARVWAENRGFKLVGLYIDPLAILQVAEGGKERCYFCKRALFEEIRNWLQQNDYSGLALCDGTNGDDLLSYRPGTRASREMGVCSPLAEAGLTKTEIRALAAATGLDAPEQKARPCLLTRFAYGMAPNHTALEALGKAEQEIENVLDGDHFGWAPFRLRLEPAPMLHIIKSVPERLAEEAVKIAVKYGFSNCGLRFVDEISGFFDNKQQKV